MKTRSTLTIPTKAVSPQPDWGAIWRREVAAPDPMIREGAWKSLAAAAIGGAASVLLARAASWDPGVERFRRRNGRFRR